MIDVRTMYYQKKYLDSCCTVYIIRPEATCSTATNKNRMDPINNTTGYILGSLAFFLI
jgi:hypothetical protein